MITLRGGPAEGTYLVRRAPLYLRAVVDANGTKDVLDELSDIASPAESISVYRLVGKVGNVHVRTSKGAGFYALAEYEHLADIDGEALRRNDDWAAWAGSQPDA